MVPVRRSLLLAALVLSGCGGGDPSAESVVRAWSEAVNTDDNAGAARLFAEAPARYTRPGLPAGCLIVTGDIGTTDKEVLASVRRIRQAKVAALTDKIKADIAAGELPADTDAQALARYTMSMLSGIAQAARDGVPRDELERVARIALTAWP